VTARRNPSLVALAIIVAAVAGGAGGWGLRHARAAIGTATGQPSTSPSATAAATPTPVSQPTSTPPPPPRRVALIGDSLSYGSGLEPPQDLPNALRKLRPDLDVIGMGIGGQESGDLLARVREFQLLHADEAVVWIGGQDADDGVPVSSFRDNLDKLIAALAPARVLLVTPIADYAVGADLYRPFVTATRALAQSHGLTLIDVGAFPRSAYQDDATHLDAANEARVAAQYAQAL
jgi:lysophospholipase L1-like esterase